MYDRGLSAILSRWKLLYSTFTHRAAEPPASYRPKYLHCGSYNILWQRLYISKFINNTRVIYKYSKFNIIFKSFWLHAQSETRARLTKSSPTLEIFRPVSQASRGGCTLSWGFNQMKAGNWGRGQFPMPASPISEQCRRPSEVLLR